jgi:quercetin dioxygenase-like cupin family protein
MSHISSPKVKGRIDAQASRRRAVCLLVAGIAALPARAQGMAAGETPGSSQGTEAANDFKHLGAGVRRENLFGGKGAFRAWPFRNVRRHPPLAAAVLCELAAGASIGEVTVDDCAAETICILWGGAQVLVDGQAITLQAGQSVDIARGSRLSLANSSRELAVQYLLQKVA